MSEYYVDGALNAANVLPEIYVDINKARKMLDKLCDEVGKDRWYGWLSTNSESKKYLFTIHEVYLDEMDFES